MMSGSRGDGGPDPFTSLLGIVGDPEGTKQRIEQLQAATKKNEEALAALATKQAENDARAIELDNMLADIEKATGALDDKQAALDAREKVIARNERTTNDLLEAAKLEAESTLRKNDAQNEAVNRVTADLAVRESELNDREAQIKADAEVIAEERAKLTKLDEQLLAKQADLDRRLVALKALVE